MVVLTENRYLRFLAVAAWMAVIFVLSSQSRLPSLSIGWADALQDIAGHFIAFGVLAVLVSWALQGAGVGRVTFWTLAVVFLYACSDELHQAFVPGRNPDPFDVATDMAGALFALFLLSRLRSRPRDRR